MACVFLSATFMPGRLYQERSLGKLFAARPICCCLQPEYRQRSTANKNSNGVTTTQTTGGGMSKTKNGKGRCDRTQRYYLRQGCLQFWAARHPSKPAEIGRNRLPAAVRRGPGSIWRAVAFRRDCRAFAYGVTGAPGAGFGMRKVYTTPKTMVVPFGAANALYSFSYLKNTFQSCLRSI